MSSGRTSRRWHGRTSSATSAAPRPWRLITGGLPGDQEPAAPAEGAPPADAARAGEPPPAGEFDRVVLDMLAPWEHVRVAAGALIPGGLICCYLATTTQLSRIVEALRGHGGFAEPQALETLLRDWHVDGLAVRPEHRMVGHTGFLVTARRLAAGVTAPPRRRRPSKGAEAAAALAAGDPVAAGH